MALLTVQEVLKTGLAPTYQAAASGGDSVPVGPKTFIHVKNGSAGALTVDVNSQQNCDQGFDHNISVSVPAGGERMIGSLEGPRFADASGLALLTYPGGVTSLTIAAIKTT